MSPDDFCLTWLAEHCELQPKDEAQCLTWFVVCRAIYAAYLKAAYLAGIDAVGTQQLTVLIQQALPGVKLKVIPRPSTQVYTGLRYYKDRIGGELLLGL